MSKLPVPALLLAILLFAAPAHMALGDDNIPPQIPLEPQLRFIIRPTVLGLVPPPDQLSYGEMLVRVTGVDDGTLNLRYEVKEEIDRDPQTHEEVPWGSEQPYGVLEKHTRIRRGAITVNGFTDSDELIHPFFWGDGDLETDTSLIWFSQSSFRRLTRQGKLPMTPLVIGNVEEDKVNPFIEMIDVMIEESGIAGDDLEFHVTDVEATYPCKVNGADVNLPALMLADNLGLAEYWVLNQADNPLILKASFIPFGDGVVEGLGLAGLASAGLGFAITEINFSEL